MARLLLYLSCVIVGIVLACGAVYAAKKGYEKLFSVDKINIDLDPLISPEQKNKIEAIASQYCVYAPYALLQELHQACPYQNNITLHYLPTGLLNIIIEAQVPTYRVNKDWFLTAQNKLVEAQWYKSAADDYYYDITVKELNPLKIPTKLSTILSNIDSQLYTYYQLYYADTTDSWLIPRQIEYPIIRWQTDALPTINIVEQAQLVCKDYQRGHKKKSNRINELIADVRFTNQIILYEKKGGMEL